MKFLTSEEPFVLTFPATAGWVAVVPVLETIFLVLRAGGLFLTTFLGAGGGSSLRKYSDESYESLLGICS